MSVWTLRQIDQARGIHAKAEVDDTTLARHHDDVLNNLHHELAKAIRQIGQTFAIEIHPADVRLSEGPAVDAPPFTVEVQARWEPQVATVELRGGWKDGERMEYRDAPQPIRIPKPPPPLMMSALENAYPTDPIDVADTYTCTGWHEQHRHWIYEAR